ncbi:MAG: hypothetical protein ISS72_08685 [Candidatus Brocadiae bacterium]|nr:hypothetical protein [Candidatus Brocadiia bacterium]
MEDLFDKTRDRWQKSFRHPLYLRYLWVFGLLLIAAPIVLPPYVPQLGPAYPRRVLALWVVVAVVVLWTFWTSFQAWRVKLMLSPTSIKAHYLFQGRMRISWDHMDRVIYKWRPLGHILVLVGTDGGRVTIRSSIQRYDEIIDLIRAKAPEHIVKQLDEHLGDYDDDDEDDAADEPEPEQS